MYGYQSVKAYRRSNTKYYSCICVRCIEQELYNFLYNHKILTSVPVSKYCIRWYAYSRRSVPGNRLANRYRDRIGGTRNRLGDGKRSQAFIGTEDLEIGMLEMPTKFLCKGCEVDSSQCPLQEVVAIKCGRRHSLELEFE